MGTALILLAVAQTEPTSGDTLNMIIQLDPTARHPGRDEMLAAGLYLGVDVVTPDGRPDAARAGAVVNGLRRRGVLISAAGPHGHVLKIRPPLPFGPDHADLLIAALEDTLTDAENSR